MVKRIKDNVLIKILATFILKINKLINKYYVYFILIL